MKKIRLDKYLWAIRIFKTRTQAASAIDNGKVKLNGEAVKPSRVVSVGDLYDIKTDTRKWIIRVTVLLENRVQYNDAIKHYIDLTPPEVVIKKTSAFIENTGKRQSKQGRPTKKNRRELNSLLG
ncbi:MAG: RNA-binding S4 domain-containing protein [Chitinophagales bacterium]